MENTHVAVKTWMLFNRDGTEKKPRQKIFGHQNVENGLIKGAYSARHALEKPNGQIGAQRFSPNKCGFQALFKLGR